MRTKPPDNGTAFEASQPLSLPAHPSVRTLPPWRYEPAVPRAPRQRGFVGAFTRTVALEPGRLGSLPAWWRRQARGEHVEIGSRLFLGVPQAEMLGVWRLGGSLRSPGHRRGVAVELWLWPHLDAWTMLELAPMQDVRTSRNYFSSGQRVIDLLCARLFRELDVPAYC
jgi:hypothetical protein